MSSNLRETAERLAAGLSADEFDREEALYWWSADHHEGQWSEAYSILSTSEFRPSRLSNGPDSSDAILIYEGLCVASGCSHAAGTVSETEG